MIDWDDPDQLLNIVGVALVSLLLVGVAFLAFSVTAFQQESIVVPDAEWNLTKVNDTHYRITHTGGDPVSAANLSVDADGRARQVQWSNATLRAGDEGVVAVENPSRITLVWKAGRETITLERW